jgi:hypothetical protein|tara:strand:+ start:156 stop:449 length:294 start_codon:yes stop_codon:yes gene_type:complete
MNKSNWCEKNNLIKIDDHHVNNHVIVIDDIVDSISGTKGWPNINEICKLIRQINSEYCITVKYGRLFAEMPQTAYDPPPRNVVVHDILTGHKMGDLD